MRENKRSNCPWLLTVWLALAMLLATSAPSSAVVPGLAAPLQALGQVLLQILPLLGAVVLGLFSVQGWRQRVGRAVLWLRTPAGVTCCLAVLGVVALGITLARPGNRTALATAAAGEHANGGLAKPPEKAAWPLFRGNLSRTGAPQGEAGPVRATVLWKFSDPDAPVADISSSPAVVGDRIYVGSAQVSIFDTGGMVYCLQAATGKRLWRFQTEKQVFCSPAVAGGKVYIGEGLHVDSDCKLYCLDAATGSKLWSVATKSHTESSPAVVGSRVYFGAGDDGAYCVNARSGDVVWHFRGRHIDGSPAVANGKVYLGTGYGSLAAIALDASTGKPVWSTPSDLPVWGSPAIAAGRVIYGIGNGDFVKSSDRPRGAVWCLDASSGHPVWRRNVPDAVLTATVAEGRSVFVGCRDGRVYRIDATSGHVSWSSPCGGPVVSSPASDGKRLYVAGSTGEVQALDVATGKQVWQLDLKRETEPDVQVFSSPCVAGGRLFVGTSKSKLFCIGD